MSGNFDSQTELVRSLANDFRKAIERALETDRYDLLVAHPEQRILLLRFAQVYNVLHVDYY